MKEGKLEKDPYFKLPKNDRLHFELEDQEEKAKDMAAEKVFEKLNIKYSNKNTAKK